jgi:AraC-like DNA-binding protein
MRSLAPDLVMHHLGVDVRRPPGKVVRRPRGSSDWLFLHFHTPIRIHSRSGKHTMPADTCILFQPGHPQHYDGGDKGYTLDFCHFAGTDVMRWAKQSGAPLNSPTVPVSTQPFTALVRSLEYEFSRREPQWRETCALLLAQLLLAFGRARTSPGGCGFTSRQAGAIRRIRDLRLQLQREFARPWTLAEMARAVHLSPSRFSHLYSQVFGKAPIDDLIEVRIQHACWLLREEHMTLKEIAPQCGFSRPAYFARVFRSRVGCPPGAYAKGLSKPLFTSQR